MSINQSSITSRKHQERRKEQSEQSQSLTKKRGEEKEGKKDAKLNRPLFIIYFSKYIKTQRDGKKGTRKERKRKRKENADFNSDEEEAKF